MDLWPLDQNLSHPVVKNSFVTTTIYKGGQGTFWFSATSFHWEKGNYSGSCLISSVETTFSLHMCTFLGHVCIDYIFR